MATLRRSLLRLRQTLMLSDPRSPVSLSGFSDLLGFSSNLVFYLGSDRMLDPFLGFIRVMARLTLTSPTKRASAGFITGFFSLFNPSCRVDSCVLRSCNPQRLHLVVGRLLYRSRQRGFLELDLVLGAWVEENIRAMDQLHIRALMDVLDLVFCAIQSKVMSNLNSHAAPETRANPGQPWVRGWDDKKGVEGGPKYGNQ
ncbi:hypothetical protein BHE74_00039684 [Ensete ventricosum]|nr:hypothetical protein GW17_00024958 [Ensete ventricosum]RWW53784.1 hypothetical protein BHE74_00039684 [Ensete ventricosum]RZS20649.1 hypothetical protein BHM03_00053177 [Ensete ventricosum]